MLGRPKRVHCSWSMPCATHIYDLCHNSPQPLTFTRPNHNQQHCLWECFQCASRAGFITNTSMPTTAKGGWRPLSSAPKKRWDKPKSLMHPAICRNRPTVFGGHSSHQAVVCKVVGSVMAHLSAVGCSFSWHSFWPWATSFFAFWAKSAHTTRALPRQTHNNHVNTPYI